MILFLDVLLEFSCGGLYHSFGVAVAKCHFKWSVDCRIQTLEHSGGSFRNDD